jgi:hypothetical protein
MLYTSQVILAEKVIFRAEVFNAVSLDIIMEYEMKWFQMKHSGKLFSLVFT